MSRTFLYSEQRHIQAPPEAVYDRLVDLDNYSAWNPWLTRASGKVAPGATVDVWPVLFGRSQHYRHLILEASRPARFAWRDLGWFSLLACGERHRTLTALPDASCQYQVSLSLTGPLASLAAALFGKELQRGLALEADALQASFSNRAATTRV